MGDGERDTQWLEGFRDCLFVFRICEGEEERDGDGLGLFRFNLGGQRFHVRGRRRGQNLAVAGGAFFDAEAEIGRDQRFDAVEEEVVELGASLASDFDGVFETGGGDQGGARAFAFQQSVGADCGAVQDYQFTFGGDFAEGFDDGLGGIGGSGEDFQHAQAAGVVDPDTVGEGAAGVDGYAEGLGAAGHGCDSEN